MGKWKVSEARELTHKLLGSCKASISTLACQILRFYRRASTGFITYSVQMVSTPPYSLKAVFLGSF